MRLESNLYLRPNERAALVQAKDARIIAKLKEMLSQDQTSWMAVLILADMGDPAAYEPLMARAMARDNSPSTEVFQALGKLGDKRAVEPLKKKLESAYGPSGSVIVESLLMLDAPGVFEQTTERIAATAAAQGDWAKFMLAALGRATGNRAVPVLEQYLDNEDLWRVAATGLWNVGTPEATAALKTRLAAENYARTEDVLTSLMEQAAYQAQAGGDEVRKTLIQRMAELLRELRNSTNPGTRKAAEDRLKLFPTE